jgi:hypothetical protein
MNDITGMEQLSVVMNGLAHSFLLNTNMYGSYLWMNELKQDWTRANNIYSTRGNDIVMCIFSKLN